MVSRIQGLLPVSEGMGERRSARIVGAGWRTLQDWIFRYRRGGLPALVKGPYPGRKPKLTQAQLAELDRVIEQGPESAGLDTGAWTAPLVADLVRKLFGAPYHPDHMRRILRRLRLTVQLSTRELSRADPAEQARWLNGELQAKKIEQECGALIYQDEASFGQPGSLHRSWARKGNGTRVKSFPGRKGTKVMGAIRAGEKPGWHLRFVERHNTDTFTTFIEQLLRYYKGRKIHPVVDNGPWHKAKKIRKWLEGIKDLIEIHFLPKYAPTLDAAEYILKETRKWASHNRFFGTVMHLKDSLFRRFNRFQGNPEFLKTPIPHLA
jgi:transposase